MKSTENRELNSQIRKRIRELQSLLEDETRDTRQQDDSKGDANEDLLNALEHQISEKEKWELARLTANLCWLGSEEGGRCEKCGCEIPYARLRAVPVTRLCINCAQ